MNEQHIYVGIDPSIASTGATICINDNVFFYNIKNKQTNKENIALTELECKDVNVILYDYENPNTYKKADTHKFELLKTNNIISVADAIKYIIIDKITDMLKALHSGEDRHGVKIVLHVCIETNAYSAGSRTTSLVELCGLNFLIRERILSLNNREVGDFFNTYGYIDSVILTCSTPSEIKKFATGRGDADKELMLYCFSLLQPEIVSKFEFLKLDDIADSFFMCEYAKHIAENSNIDPIILYNEKQQERLSDKINDVKNQKRENKITIKNMKNKKSVWDESMMSFADQLK